MAHSLTYGPAHGLLLGEKLERCRTLLTAHPVDISEQGGFGICCRCDVAAQRHEARSLQ